MIHADRSNRKPRTPILIPVLAAAILLAGGVATAHVALDKPNGGEMLEAGSTYQVAWHDVINHGPANFDLWYSVNSEDGPWTVIAMDLTPEDNGGYVYDWTVPDDPSTRVRVRVRQDNDNGSQYLDDSDGDLTIEGAAATPETVTLEPARDGTLYAEDGTLANGAGSYFFTGRTQQQNGGSERRAVLAFDLSTIPAGSTVTSVDLQLTMSKTTSGQQTVEIRRLLESWGEGTSVAPGQQGGGGPATAGDATWVYRTYPDVQWSTPGGTFSQSASASLAVSSPAIYTFESTPQLVADVQAWVDDPGQNFGWALVEPDPPVGGAKRFNTRENADAGTRPMLTVTYESGATSAPTADFSFAPDQPVVGEVVTFTDLSTGQPASWSWDFGDGGSSTEQNPTHTFTSAGARTVSLTAANDAGDDTTTQDIVVSPTGSPDLTEVVLVPAAANAAGSGTSFYITTLDVHNAGSTAAFFRLQWLPRGADNSSPTESDLFSLEPGATRRFDDVLGDAFGLSNAFGAVAIISDSADIEAVSRTFNQSTDGTFGQSLPGLASDQLIPAGTHVRVLFLTEDAAYRSNLGLANGTDSSITVDWELFDADGHSLKTGSTSLLPWSNTQLNRVLANFAPIEAAYAEMWTTTPGGLFACYGSVLDEATSDPTTVLPQ